MGNIGMIKGVLLAWLLCRRKGIFGSVDIVDHRISSGLEVYRREEGKETINMKQTNAPQGMTWQYAVLGVT